jgi:Asp-tRNA(Asn)/Glu-tRNA(Gln) amidotransferase A subunit family amidase
VSNHGTLDPWPSLDHTGVIARNVADAASLAANIVDEAHPIASTVRAIESPRLVAMRSPVWELAGPEQRAMLENNVATLRSTGARVTEAELPGAFDRAHTCMRIIMAYEAARHFKRLQDEHRTQMSARFNALLDEGQAIGAAQYEDTLVKARALRAAYSEFIANCDAVITPPAPGEAPRALDQTGDPAFCSIWSLLGAPAVTIPVGLGPRGLPLGLQVVAKYGGDDTALAVAAWCEARLPFGGLLQQES